jgi:hypothetical protein
MKICNARLKSRKRLKAINPIYSDLISFSQVSQICNVVKRSKTCARATVQELEGLDPCVMGFTLLASAKRTAITV